jgi:prevent-host-death family protein
MRESDVESKPRVGTRDFRDNLRAWLRRAEAEPVTITVAGYDRHVIVGIELWRKLKKRAAA